MKITHRHPASKYGNPVILSNKGKVMSYAEGIKEIRKSFQLSTKDIAKACGISHRTVENWEQGRRTPSAAALNVISDLIS